MSGALYDLFQGEVPIHQGPSKALVKGLCKALRFHEGEVPID